jgi:predicted RNase H-like nuclease (RuvC/YqgF family)
MNTKKLMIIALGSMMFASPAYVMAQQDQDSVVDAARKAQADKKEAPKSKLVIDNDNLGTLTGTVNVVGEAPAPPDDQSKKDDKAGGTKAPVKGESYWRDKFAAANKKLADDAKELDITQRELNLKQEQFYTDPMASLKQDYSRQDINDSKTKIDQLTQKVAQDKADISDLEDQLRQAGGEPGWATPPSQPSQSASTSETSQPNESTQPPGAAAPPAAPAAPATPAQ